MSRRGMEAGAESATAQRIVDPDASAGALVDALLDAMDAPTAVVLLPSCEVERATDGFPYGHWGGSAHDPTLPGMAEALASGRPPPSGVEWRPVDAQRMLVIHRRPERDDAIAALQRAEADEDIADALGRLALAEGAEAAQVVSVSALGHATVLSTHGRTASAKRRTRPMLSALREGASPTLFDLDSPPASERRTPDSPRPDALVALDSDGPSLVKRVWSGRAPELHLRLWGPSNGTLHALEDCADRVVQAALPLIARQRLVARLERATEELSQRNAEFRSVLDTVRDPLWLVDEAGVVQLSNDAATELSGGHLSSLTQLARRAADERSRLRLSERPREGRVRVQIQTSEGVRRIELTVTPLGASADPARSFVVSGRDVTREADRLRGLETLVRVGQVATRPLAPAPLATALANCIRKHFRLDTVALWLPGEADGATPGRTGTAADPLPLEPLGASGNRTSELRHAQAFTAALTATQPVFFIESGALHAAVGFSLRNGARGVLAAARWGTEPVFTQSLLPYRHPLKVLARIVAQALDVAMTQVETDEAHSILSAALGALPDAVLVTDEEGRVRSANDEALRLIAQAAKPVPDLSLRPYADDVLAALNVRETDGEALAPPVREALRGRPISTEVHLDTTTGDTTAEDTRSREQSRGDSRRGAPRLGSTGSARNPATQLRQAVLSSIPLAPVGAGEPSGAVVVVQDVSRERELERMKDTFLSMAAHELRTPLAAMKAYAQHTQRTANQLPGGEKLTRSLAVIERQTDRMHSLVSDLLEVSKLVAGSLTLHTQPADLSRLVGDACEHLSGLSHQHELNVDVRGRLWAHVDVLRCEQVLTNLVSNAIRYSPGGGRVDVCAFASDGEAIIEVRDEGIGIAPERARLIFDRFYRGHDDPRLGAGGLGLGLWIAREIVLRHNGRIEVESQLGLGSTFRVLLPLNGPPLR